MQGEIDDGQLLPIAFDFFTGMAGIRTVGIETQAAYAGASPGRDAIGKIGMVGDRRWIVRAARKSSRSSTMTILVLEPDAG